MPHETSNSARGFGAFRFPYDKFEDEIALYENFRYLQEFLQRLGVGDKYAATVVVASATSHNTSQAHFKCSGVNDQTVIQEAIDALPTVGGEVVLLEGTYNIAGTITFPTRNVVLRGLGKAVINAASGSVITGSGTSTSTHVMGLTGLEFTGGVAGMNFIFPYANFWFTDNLIQDFTVRHFIVVSNLLQYTRDFIHNNVFQDVSIETTGTDFNVLGLVMHGSGGSREGLGIVSNNVFRNITHTTHTGATYQLTYCAGTDRPLIVANNIVENSSTLDDYFSGTDFTAHNVIDGVVFAGNHNMNLDDLLDVVITGTPADNEVVAYDTGTSKFINQTAAEAGLSATGHAHTESDISDLDHDDTDAIHDNVAGEINALTTVTAANGDVLVIEDASDSFNKKKVTAEDFLAAGGGAGAAFNEFLLIGG